MALLRHISEKIGKRLVSRLDRELLAKALAAAGWLADDSPTPAKILKAVEAFQEFHNLKVDGIVGAITGRLLLTERVCACGDRMPLRESVAEPRWNHSPVTVGTNIARIGSVANGEILDIFGELIDQVEANCGLRLMIADKPSRANILLTAERIDGSSGVLGDQYLPVGVDASSQLIGRLDTSERFVNSASPGVGEVDVVGTIAHETFGHGLGLRHVAQNGPDSLMKPYKTAIRRFMDVDLDALRRLYPGPAKRAEPNGPVLDTSRFVTRQELAQAFRDVADRMGAMA